MFVELEHKPDKECALLPAPSKKGCFSCLPGFRFKIANYRTKSISPPPYYLFLVGAG